MPDKKFELGDYVEVKDRIKLFYELFGQGRLVTGEVRLSNEPDGVPRVMVQGLAYRTPDDPLPGVGWSWLELPGKTPYTRGSEIENAETSAWGRAIGSLGILIDRSIASSQEVQNKAGAEQERPAAPRSGFVGTEAHPAPLIDDGGLIGTAITEGNYDFGLRQVAPDPANPDGPKWKLPFRVKNGSKSFIVVAEDNKAEALAMLREKVIGQRVTVWGHWSDETIPAKGTKPAIRYRILHLERIATPEFTLPAPAFDPLLGRGGPLEPTDRSEDAADPMPEFPEAPSVPLFDEAAMAALDAEAGAA